MELNLFEPVTRSVPEMIKDGMEAKLLRSNEIFARSILDVYQEICYEQDKLALSSDPEAPAHIERLSLLRANLTKIVSVLDSYISEAEALDTGE